MFNKRIHHAYGGLERREPIGGLLRNIEGDLYTVRGSLLLCWKIPSGQRTNLARILNPLTSTLNQVAPGGPGFRRIVFAKHVLASNMWVLM